MFPFAHLQTYQMRLHFMVLLIIRIRISPASSTSHSNSFSPVSSATFVLYDSSSCGNRQYSTFHLVKLPPLVGIYCWMGQVLAVCAKNAQFFPFTGYDGFTFWATNVIIEGYQPRCMQELQDTKTVVDFDIF